MPLHAQQFFTERLTLPFDGGAVVGDTYYAGPPADSPLRLRINFHSGIRHGEYTGLRLRIVHLEHGPIDSAVLSFADYEVFRRRDTRLARRPRDDGYGVFRDWHTDSKPPWHDGDFTAIRQAVTAYARMWLPALTPGSAATRPAGLTHTTVPGGPPRSQGTAARAGR